MYSFKMSPCSVSCLVAFVLHCSHFQWLLWSDPDREEHTSFRSCHFRVSASVVLLHLTGIGHSWRRRIGKTGNTHGNSSYSKHTQKATHNANWAGTSLPMVISRRSLWRFFLRNSEHFQNCPRLLGCLLILRFVLPTKGADRELLSHFLP